MTRTSRPNPLVEGNPHTTHRRSPAAFLSAGFIAAAGLVYAVGSFAGTALGISRIPVTARLWIGAALCLGFAVVDVVMMRRRQLCSVGPIRQTPRRLIDRFGLRVGPLMWGLDTGLAVTTIRISAITWAALGLSVLKVAPWWVGLVYGVGFALPVTVALLVPRWRDTVPGAAPLEPQWIPRALMRLRHSVRVVCAVALALAAAVLAVS